MKNNNISSEKIRTNILNNVQRIIINGFYDRLFTITNINGYELLMQIFQFDDCVSLSCHISNQDNGVCLVSCDEYCEHTLHLKDYTKDELYDTITEYFYNKYCLFTYMLDDIKSGVMTESMNCYNYGFEFAGDWEEAFSTMCESFENETDEENDCIDSKKKLPETLDELVDRFATDDEYATKLINDEIEADDFSDLYDAISCGLAEKYSVMTGKELHEVDALVIANKLIENRCDELGINCVVDSIEKKVYWMTCIDEDGEPVDTFKNFKANTLPFVVKMAEAKANAMCVKLA